MMDAKTIGIMASIGAAAFVGYCIYFDHKRRSSPDFKENLKARRKQADQSGDHTKQQQLPDFSNQEEVQRFFLQEVQLGEELLAQGDVENGVEHLSMAVAVCGQPHSLLGVLQQTIPPQIYSLLLQNLEKAKGKVRAHAALSIDNSNNKEINNTEKPSKKKMSNDLFTQQPLFPNRMAQC